MNKIEKMAKKDAERYMAAEMFYGEGAGVRRRHMDAEVLTKQEDPAYYDAFMTAYEALDLNKFAKAAIKEREHIDRTAKAAKNFRALKSGNLTNLSTGVFYAGAGYYFFYHTHVGVDMRKKGEVEAKKLYKRAKAEVKFRKARWQGKNVTKIVG